MVIRSFSFIVWETCAILELGFINIMCDKTVGTTHLSLLGAVNNIVGNLIETLSIYLLSYVNYEWYFVWGIIYMIIMLLNTKHYAIALDEAHKDEFKLKRDDHIESQSDAENIADIELQDKSNKEYERSNGPVKKSDAN